MIEFGGDRRFNILRDNLCKAYSDGDDCTLIANCNAIADEARRMGRNLLNKEQFNAE